MPSDRCIPPQATSLARGVYAVSASYGMFLHTYLVVLHAARIAWVHGSGQFAWVHGSGQSGRTVADGGKVEVRPLRPVGHR